MALSDDFVDEDPGRLFGRTNDKPIYTIRSEPLFPLLQSAPGLSKDEKRELIIKRANYATLWHLCVPIRGFDWVKYHHMQTISIQRRYWSLPNRQAPMRTKELSGPILKRAAVRDIPLFFEF